MIIESKTFSKKYITSLQKQMKTTAECKSFLIKVSSQTFSGNIYTAIAKIATIYWLFDTLYSSSEEVELLLKSDLFTLLNYSFKLPF